MDANMDGNTDASRQIQRDELRGISVLVVDDEPVLASTFCLVLQFAGAASYSAANGRIALAMTTHQTFDVILCDRWMPIMNGTDFIREFRRRGNTTPVLLFLSAVDQEGLEALADLHIAGTVAKPILPAQLIQAVQRAIPVNATENGAVVTSPS